MADITVSAASHRKIYVMSDGKATLPDPRAFSDEFRVTILQGGLGTFEIVAAASFLGYTGNRVKLSVKGQWAEFYVNRDKARWAVLRGGPMATTDDLEQKIMANLTFQFDEDKRMLQFRYATADWKDACVIPCCDEPVTTYVPYLEPASATVTLPRGEPTNTPLTNILTREL